MRLLSCYFPSRNPADRTWQRLAAVLAQSAMRHAPNWDVTIEEMPAALVAGDRLSEADQANTQKLRWWTRQVMDAKDGDLLLLCDTDTFVTGNLDEIAGYDFDVAYTVRAAGRIPFNAGVIFVRVNDSSRWFMADWAAFNEQLAKDHQARKLLRHTYVGINQSALGVTLDAMGQSLRADVLPLPCSEWNCEDTSWDQFNPASTKVVHLKGALRRDVLAATASRPALAPIVSLWRLIESEAQ